MEGCEGIRRHGFQEEEQEGEEGEEGEEQVEEKEVEARAVFVFVVKIKSRTNFRITFAVTQNCQAAEKQFAIHNTIAVIKYIEKTQKHGSETLYLVRLMRCD